MAFMRDPLYVLAQDGYVLIGGPNDMGTIRISQDSFDELVMMRYYQLTGEDQSKIIERVLKTQFETGADAIRKYYGFPTVMERAMEGIQARIGEEQDI